MKRLFFAAVAAGTLFGACASNDDHTEEATSPRPATTSTSVQVIEETTAPRPAPTSTSGQPTEEATFNVGSLGLTFRLPKTFISYKDPSYTFSASNQNSNSLLAIVEKSPEITHHVAQPGETMSDLDLDGVDAVVVTDAVLEGLPPDRGANLLLVSNGEQSFLVILVSSTATLSRLWDHFLASVSVTPVT